MLRRVLEAIFRHPIRLLILLLILPIISVAVVYLFPREYQTTASLWALRRYTIIGATGPETDLLATPAETQATALGELLQSRTFVLAVAQQTRLASTLDPSVQADPSQRDDALFNEISKNVKVAAEGYNLYTVSYTNHDAVISMQVVSAVIQQYGLEGQSFSVVEAHRLLASYQTQLAQAQQQAQQAAQAEARYIAAHPNLSRADLQSDPQYALLHAQSQQAQATVASLQDKINSLNQDLTSQGTSSDSLFSILDSPKVPVKPVSRIKDFLIGGGVGLALALAACTLYVLMTVRRNRAVYTPLDLQKVTSLPVVMQLPMLVPEAVPLLVQPAHQNGAKEDSVH